MRKYIFHNYKLAAIRIYQARRGNGVRALLRREPTGRKNNRIRRIDMRTYLSKQNIKEAFVLFAAVFNFIALLFTTVSATHTTLAGVERYYANGFTLAFSDCPEVCEEMKNWLMCYSRVHFCISLAVILTLAVIAIARGRLRFGGFGIAAVIISLVTSLVYMINGVVANYLAADYATLYYEHYTLAPLGFVLVLASAIAALLVHLFMNEK